LRAPATAEIDRLGQPQAVEHFNPLRGSGGPIEASPLLLHRRHCDRLEDPAEDAIGARGILPHSSIQGPAGPVRRVLGRQIPKPDLGGLPYWPVCQNVYWNAK
jgi:hypothetical protein